MNVPALMLTFLAAFLSSNTIVREVKPHRAAHGIQLSIDRANAIRRPYALTRTTTAIGPAPFPTSSNRTQDANAKPLRLDSVTLLSVARILGPVIAAKVPPTTASIEQATIDEGVV